MSLIEENETMHIVFLHIVSSGQVDQVDAENDFDELREKVQTNQGASCDCFVKEGELISEIVQSREETNSNLIIMGTKGAAGGGDDTNTSRLVMEVDCPVLVIPEKNTRYNIRNIALALGKNEIDDSFSLSILHGIARKFGAKIHILTIANDENDVEMDKNEDILDYYFETLDYQYAFPKNADIEKGIFDYVKLNNIDLVAMLPRNHARKSKPSEGRLTELLTLHTELPLLTVD